MKVKIFKLDHAGSLELIINSWLDKEMNKNIKVTKITQSECGAANGYNITICIWYYE